MEAQFKDLSLKKSDFIVRQGHISTDVHEGGYVVLGKLDSVISLVQRIIQYNLYYLARHCSIVSSASIIPVERAFGSLTPKSLYYFSTNQAGSCSF
jgi:hypothetical protein